MRHVTKKSVPCQNRSPQTDFDSQNWSPLPILVPRENVWIYNNLAMHGLPAHAAACCSDCYCTVQLKGNVALARNFRVRVELTYLSAILTDRNSQQVLAP